MDDNCSEIMNSFYSKLTTFSNLIEKQEKQPLLKTGCKVLNDFFLDGFRNGQIIELVGESGSGKSNFCLQLALMVRIDT